MAHRLKQPRPTQVSVNQTDIVLHPLDATGLECESSHRRKYPSIVTFAAPAEEAGDKDILTIGALPLPKVEGEKKLNGIFPTLTLCDFSEWDCYVEIRLRFRWTNNKNEAILAMVYLLKHEDLEEIAEVFDIEAEVLRKNFEHAHARYGRLWKLSIPHGPASLSANLFTIGTDGYFENELQILRRALDSEHGKIDALVFSNSMQNDVEVFNDRLEAIRGSDPLLSWYRQGSKIVLKLRQILCRDKRPQIQVNPQLVYNDFSRYLTVYGFAAIEEDELADDNSKIASGYIKVVKLEPCGNIVKIDVENKGDTFDSAMAWHAEVTDASPFAGLNETTLYLTRPYDTQTGTYDTTPINGVRSFGRINNFEKAVALVSRLKHNPVMFHVTYSDRVIKRQINALRKLTDSLELKSARQTIMGSRIDQMEKVSMYAAFESADGFEEYLRDVMQEFNEDQQAAVLMCQNLPNGIGLVQGPPGTGKTFWISSVIQPPLAEMNLGRVPRRPVLICSSTNNSVDALTKRTQDISQNFVDKHKLPKMPIIVRMHALSTEKKVVVRAINSKRSDKKPDILQGEEQDLTQILAALVTSEDYARFQFRPHEGVADRRVKLIENSLGSWMLRVSGIIPDDPLGDAKRHAKFGAHFFQWSTGGKLTPEECINFTASINELRKHVFSIMDVLITTASNAGDPKLYEIMQPSLIIIDEAARMSEPDAWSFFAFYSSEVPKIFVGDMAQLKPSARYDNKFKQHLSLSLMGRFSLIGYPLTMFTMQHRMHSKICNLVSSVFYDGKITTAPGIDKKELSRSFSGYMLERFKMPRNVLMMNCVDSISELGAKKSPFNVTHIILVTDIIRGLLERGIKPSSLAVLTSYSAQFAQYRSAFAALQALFPGLDMRSMTLGKIDTFQGEEADIVILDLPNHERLGFLDDPSRLNVGLSRGKCGLILVANSSVITKNKRYTSSYLARVFSYLKRANASKVMLRSAIAEMKLPDSASVLPKTDDERAEEEEEEEGVL
ncbi:putative atp-dependent helicase nam7 protein [Neofusicoccum parvum UCRNP2]|uniref:Putative atp-dependent helicase nam7 protein n=1 Tax=Botryosphaeria parva (strain UCR-NP2) TaxID=1287680 RepID=R1GHM2_BOTPV|nr:putative atp-dependent helicase nam7 protein [Neofusicoccum parvum UCRNP2]